MTFYISIFIFLVLGMLIVKPKWKKLYGGLLMLVLSISVGVRDGIGTDYEAYFFSYKSLNKIEDILNIHGEIGFNFLAYMIKSIGFDEPYFFFFIVSFFSFFFLRLAVKKFKLEKYTLEILFIYYCFFFLNYHYNIIRHGFMSSVIWLSFYYAYKRDLRSFLILIFIGMLIQKLAVLFVPFYWLLRIRLSKKHLLVLSGVAALSLTTSFLISFIIPFFVKIIPIPSISYALNFYATMYYWDGNSSKGWSLGFIVYLSFFLFLFFKRKRMYEIQRFNIFFNALYFAIMFYLLLNEIGVFVERISGLLYVSLCFLIPLFIKKIGSKDITNKVISYIILVLYGMLIFQSNLNKKENDGGLQFVPYVSVKNIVF